MPDLGGKFLIAKTSLQDPNFRQTVVLIVQHNDEGAFGLVVNRPVPPMKQIPCSVYAGGPCEAQGLFLLHGHREWLELDEELNPEEPGKEIAPGIFLGDAECIERIDTLEDEDTKVRMFAGYAGWGPGQLESELNEGAWSIADADGSTLFQTPSQNLWQHLRPPAIPKPSLN